MSPRAKAASELADMLAELVSNLRRLAANESAPEAVLIVNAFRSDLAPLHEGNIYVGRALIDAIIGDDFCEKCGADFRFGMPHVCEPEPGPLIRFAGAEMDPLPITLGAEPEGEDWQHGTPPVVPVDEAQIPF